MVGDSFQVLFSQQDLDESLARMRFFVQIPRLLFSILQCFFALARSQNGLWNYGSKRMGAFAGCQNRRVVGGDR